MNAVLRDGQKETGITIMYMSEGMDEGDILKKEALSIGENENFDSLCARMGELGGKMIVECLDLLEEGNAPRIAQNDNEATYCQLLTREDERIDWKQSGWDIHNQCRSLSSEPGAYTFYQGAPFKLIRTSFEKGEASAEAGTVIGFDKKKGVSVAVNDGILRIQTVKPQGKKEMNANDWYRGIRDKEGLRFTSEQS